jgi:hypothetical protein
MEGEGMYYIQREKILIYLQIKRKIYLQCHREKRQRTRYYLGYLDDLTWRLIVIDRKRWFLLPLTLY